MENIFHHLCWVCNTQQEKLLNIEVDQIKGTNISQMLEYCTQDPLNITSKLIEANICYNCVKYLEISYNFLQRYNQTQKEIKVVQDRIIDTKSRQQKLSFKDDETECISTRIEDPLQELVMCNKSSKRNTREKKLICSSCKKIFFTEKALNLHTRIYHKQ